MNDTAPDISTDVLIVGTGPAGSSMAALLSSAGIDNLAINRYRWLANTPRAHITNQRTMEVLRDLGREVEEEAYLHATPKELMGENIFCTSLAGEEIGRLKTWGTHPESAAAHLLASPTHMNDLPQTFMEPLLYKTACSRGTQSRLSTEYVSHEQDAEGVTTVCRDRLTGRDFTVRSKYLIGADGGNSKVAEHAGLEFEGKMAVAGSINILIRADLSKYVAHRPSVLYWVLQPGSNVGGIGMGVVRMVRPWNEWLLIWGYDIERPAPEVDEEFARNIARSLVGDPELEVELQGVSTWTVNDMYAETLSNGRVFCAGDAIHRHPPSNGLGSNTSIQDSFNLAWKLAHVIRGQADASLLDTYQTERAPIAKQIVKRANQSIGEFGPIFESLGLLDSIDPVKMQANMDARVDDTEAAEKQRTAIRDAIAFKRYEFDAHGVEMNHRYDSDAVVRDASCEMPAFERDAELHYHPTTCPGARLPHAWLFDEEGHKVSSLDLCGHGRFSLLTGIGGDAWEAAAETVGARFGVEITTHRIGPRQRWQDFTGDWARAREIRDAGCLLVRPDHHVGWRAPEMVGDPEGELARALGGILGRNATGAGASARQGEAA